AALARAGSHRELEARLRAKTAEREDLLARAEAEKQALGLSLDPKAAARLPVPAPETVDLFAHRGAALDKERDRLDHRAADIAHRDAAVARDIEALERAGRVPTEEDLIAARQAR